MEGILVAVRLRPLSVKEISLGIQSCCQSVDQSLVAIKKFGEIGGYLKSQQASVNDYAFDVAFDENASQLEVYERTAKPFIKNAIAGENVTVFAYGATGAGKTHTMLGNTRADESAVNVDAGIIPNAVKDLFFLIDSTKNQLQCGEAWEVTVSFIEVYNEQVYDLLEPTRKILSVREDQERGIVVVAGVTENIVTDYIQVIDLLQQGNRNRKTEATLANSYSSRSHAVLQLSVKHKRINENGKELVVESKLSLIDLAGSERASATSNRGVRLNEGANINKSLLALANCINTLSLNGNNKKLNNVKYRDSKLTHLLKSSLEGNCNLIMIANINPSHLTYEDSHNTLKYANRAKNIKVNPLAKESIKDSSILEKLTRLTNENEYLRAKVLKLEEIIQQFNNNENSNVFVQKSITNSNFSNNNGKIVFIIIIISFNNFFLY
jgi:kinesin family protein 18/19